MGQAHVHRLAFVSNAQEGQHTSDNMLDFLKLSHENLKTEDTVRVQSQSFSLKHHSVVWDSELPEGVLSCWMGLDGS